MNRATHIYFTTSLNEIKARHFNTRFTKTDMTFAPSSFSLTFQESDISEKIQESNELPKDNYSNTKTSKHNNPESTKRLECMFKIWIEKDSVTLKG